MNTPEVHFNVTDNSAVAISLEGGIVFLLGKFKRGPVNDPKDIISSIPQFTDLYGDYVEGGPDAPLLVKHFLEKGASCRIANIRHYSDITDKSSLTAAKAETANITDSLFKTTITYDANIITGNDVAITINGNTYTQAFTTNNDTTLKLLAQQILLGESTTLASLVLTSTHVLTFTPVVGETINVSATSVTGGASQANGVIVNGQTITSVGIVNVDNVTLFELPIKFPGADYNNIYVDIFEASNKQTGYFNLSITFDGETQLNEIYENLIIGGFPTVAQSTYLKDVSKKSKLVDVIYHDLSGLDVNKNKPALYNYQFAGGSDGDAVVAGDYVGDETTLTGFHAFNPYDDAMIIAAPEMDDNDIHIAGAAYVANREDLVYFAHLSNDDTVATDLIADRNATNIDQDSAAFFGGGEVILNPITGTDKQISELASAMGLYAHSHKVNGAHMSVANKQRAQLLGIKGVVNNFGTKGRKGELNALANAQINMAINRNNTNMLWHQFTAQRKTSLLSLLNVKFGVLSIIRDIRPVLENHIEDPFPSLQVFRKIYNEIFPYFTDKVNAGALADWDWQGDQFAKSLDKLVINNNAADIVAGKYKVKLFLQPIGSIQQIVVEISLSPAGVSFKTLG